MPCDPKPGLWAYLVCALSALLAHPLQLTASVLLLGAAVTAALLARRRADHRPIAWALGAVFAADLVGAMLAPALSSPGPFAGWRRLAFHLDEARFLVWPLALQWCVGLAFVGVTTWRDRARPVLRISLLPFYGLMLAICVLCYPSLRGAALSYFYACVHANALGWCLVMIGTWWTGSKAARAEAPNVARLLGLTEREQAALDARFTRRTPARIVASLLVALSALSAVAGPWWRGLFDEAYEAERVILCAMYAGIVGVQAWSLCSVPRVAGKPGAIPRPLGQEDETPIASERRS